MDYNTGGAYPGSNAIEIIPDTSAPWAPPLSSSSAAADHSSIWATDDDYSEPTSRAGSEQPPTAKRPRGAADTTTTTTSKSKAIGKMFFKTKLCCKFRAGTCPYITNCNFAHGMEELRKPPPNWQEIVAAHEEGVDLPPREEHQIPILTSSALVLPGDGQRSYKGRHCKKFYTEEGCPYGDSCTFLHDEQSKARESVAISLSPTVGAGGYGAGPGGQNQKPSNWKTRICNKWEMTGYCPFGSKCHFAHGAAELHRNGDGLGEMDGRDPSSVAPDSKPVGASTRTPLDTVVGSNMAASHSDVYHMGASAQRSAGVTQRQGQRPLQKWKGPDKISRIYGDWIDEND